ncbi:MAG TPA: UDP-4-amino-4,6-dideoxy-N-acetyl-beta-L-altrosamine transaminase [Gemmataceae bacterium]|nr:UDP-4-amino-4,6-dideoxy-N-acetyl-beta-L-altrosamine transaminase [Gemmataceae bacterium]
MSATDAPLPYGRQWIDEKDIHAVVEVLRGDWLTQGPLIRALEQALTDFCGARYAVAVSSGTAALHLACLAAGVGPGDGGLTSPISFAASANCVAYCGGTPGFVDVDPRTITMDPNALEHACRRQRPKVILPVDFSGQPADLPAIYEIARRVGARVIEDAAHSLGATYSCDGQSFRVGSCAHADMVTLSFHPVKHITTGEGGAILTNDAALYQRLLDLRTHGITKDPARLTRDEGPWYYEQHELGFNYRITDFQCALGLSQMKRLATFVARRRELVQRYSELLADLRDDVRLLTEVPGRRSSYHLLVAQIRGGAPRRRAVFERLQAAGIRTQVHYFPIHLQPWYSSRFGFRAGDFPQAEAYYAGCLSLPLFPRMADADVERSVAALRSALAAG